MAIFTGGSTVITRNAFETLHRSDVRAALNRHARGDWGDVSFADWEANEFALAERTGRIHSSHHGADGETFWIITEADHSVTTVLLPEDYYP